MEAWIETRGCRLDGATRKIYIMNLSRYLKLALRGQLSLRDIRTLRKAETKLSAYEVSQLIRAVRKARKGNGP